MGLARWCYPPGGVVAKDSKIGSVVCGRVQVALVARWFSGQLTSKWRRVKVVLAARWCNGQVRMVHCCSDGVARR